MKGPAYPRVLENYFFLVFYRYIDENELNDLFNLWNICPKIFFY